jgi:hypothetical protein
MFPSTKRKIIFVLGVLVTTFEYIIAGTIYDGLYKVIDGRMFEPRQYLTYIPLVGFSTTAVFGLSLLQAALVNQSVPAGDPGVEYVSVPIVFIVIKTIIRYFSVAVVYHEAENLVRNELNSITSVSLGTTVIVNVAFTIVSMTILPRYPVHVFPEEYFDTTHHAEHRDNPAMDVHIVHRGLVES